MDDQIRQALERAIAGVRGHLETDLRAFAQDLTRATAEERTRAIAEATESAITDVRQRAHQQLALIRDAAQKHTDELRRSAETQIADLRAALDDAGRRAQVEIEDARRTAQTQVDDVQRVMAERVADLQGRLADTERRLNDALREVGEARASSSAAAEALIVAQLAAAAAEHEHRQAAAVEAVRAVGERTAQEHATRLVSAIQSLDDARSLGDVLERLAQAAGREADRVAVLVARGEQLVGWSVLGFGGQTDAPRGVTLDPAQAGLPGTVLQSGAPAQRHDAGPGLPPFARDAGARHALALPIVVGGATVAVLYADVPSSDARADARWPAVLDVLARHAGMVLETLTVQQAAGLSWSRPLARPSHPVAALSHDRGVQ